jgi:ParB family chromosome partitioning protein
VTAPTALVEVVLAQAGVRAGLMHLTSKRDTGALNPVCGANPVRSKEIGTWATVPADLSALCADCAGLALRTPGVETVEQGLAVWLGTDDEAPGVARLLELPVAAIAVVDDAHRAVDAESDAFAQLVASVLEHGVLQPIVVRRTTAGPELVLGRRRLAAAAAAGIESIPALVRDLTDEEATLASLVENLHRADLNPIEQALAYQRALELLELTKEALADRLHVSRSQVSNTVRLLGLPQHLREHVAAGAISAAHARELLRLPQGPEQDELAAAILGEGLSVKDTAARRAAVPAQPNPQLESVSALLAGILAARVQLTAKAGETTRIVIDVPDADLERVLTQLGVQAA